jgi:hypothetical protein
LERTGKVITGTSRVVSDGPCPESKDLIGGYMVITASLARNPMERRFLSQRIEVCRRG